VWPIFSSLARAEVSACAFHPLSFCSGRLTTRRCSKPPARPNLCGSSQLLTILSTVGSPIAKHAGKCEICETDDEVARVRNEAADLAVLSRSKHAPCTPTVICTLTQAAAQNTFYTGGGLFRKKQPPETSKPMRCVLPGRDAVCCILTARVCRTATRTGGGPGDAKQLHARIMPDGRLGPAMRAGYCGYALGVSVPSSRSCSVRMIRLRSSFRPGRTALFSCIFYASLCRPRPQTRTQVQCGGLGLAASGHRRRRRPEPPRRPACMSRTAVRVHVDFAACVSERGIEIGSPFACALLARVADYTACARARAARRNGVIPRAARSLPAIVPGARPHKMDSAPHGRSPSVCSLRASLNGHRSRCRRRCRCHGPQNTAAERRHVRYARGGRPVPRPLHEGRHGAGRGAGRGGTEQMRGAPPCVRRHMHGSDTLQSSHRPSPHPRRRAPTLPRAPKPGRSRPRPRGPPRRRRQSI
jgi:hypothetical protein